MENFFSSAYCTDNFAFKTMINCPRLLKGCKLQSSAEKKIQIKNYSVQIKKKKLRFFYTNYEMCSTISLQCNSFYQSYSKKNPFYKIFRELNQQIWRECISIKQVFCFSPPWSGAVSESRGMQMMSLETILLYSSLLDDYN